MCVSLQSCNPTLQKPSKFGERKKSKYVLPSVLIFDLTHAMMAVI